MNNTSRWLFMVLMSVVIVSCEDEKIEDLNDVIQLKSSETFFYDFNISGDEEGATIIEQAAHFEISELQRDESTNWSVIYRYKPEEDYLGKDTVAIETCTGGTGLSCTDLDTIVFVFTITE